MTKRIRILLTLFLLVVGTAMSWAEFTDFYIDFQSDPYEVILPEDGKLPSNVTVDRNIYNGPQHGAQNPTITVEVTGPVKFTIGSCQYGDHKVTVKDENGTLSLMSSSAMIFSFCFTFPVFRDIFPQVWRGRPPVFHSGFCLHRTVFSQTCRTCGHRK